MNEERVNKYMDESERLLHDIASCLEKLCKLEEEKLQMEDKQAQMSYRLNEKMDEILSILSRRP